MAYQDFDHGQICHVYAGVTSELWKTPCIPTLVSTAEALGDLSYGPNEAIRVVLTDGWIGTTDETTNPDQTLSCTFDIGERKGQGPSYTVFLIQNNVTKDFRVVYNKLKQA
jgi:hypothetical protein